jgi:hypothetical protein
MWSLASSTKRYTRFVSHSNEHHYAGIQFFTTDSRKIVNFPKYHSVNCTTKHQASNNYFTAMPSGMDHMAARSQSSFWIRVTPVIFCSVPTPSTRIGLTA